MTLIIRPLLSRARLQGSYKINYSLHLFSSYLPLSRYYSYLHHNHHGSDQERASLGGGYLHLMDNGKRGSVEGTDLEASSRDGPCGEAGDERRSGRVLERACRAKVMYQ